MNDVALSQEWLRLRTKEPLKLIGRDVDSKAHDNSSVGKDLLHGQFDVLRNHETWVLRTDTDRVLRNDYISRLGSRDRALRHEKAKCCESKPV